ncbi:hypothetical protein EDC01DRAFT_647783 [Geopyxis carbonaria]|nr:hypothetical protein EDC01DRAFT_647783 [Geopyxis carbonaria]
MIPSGSLVGLYSAFYGPVGLYGALVHGPVGLCGALVGGPVGLRGAPVDTPLSSNGFSRVIIFLAPTTILLVSPLPLLGSKRMV